MHFGIFRKATDELLIHFDEAGVKEKLLVGLCKSLPVRVEQRRFRKDKVQNSWDKGEIIRAFKKAWAEAVRSLKDETIRIQ